MHITIFITLFITHSSNSIFIQATHVREVYHTYSLSPVYTPFFPLIFMFQRPKCRGANVGGATAVGATVTRRKRREAQKERRKCRLGMHKVC